MKWFLAGLGIGVGIGIVMAPARGEESRRKLREGATRAWDEMSDEARATLDEMRSSDWARQARNVASQARDRVSAMRRDAQERFDDEEGNIREQAPDNLRKVVDRVAGAAGASSSNSQTQAAVMTRRSSLLEMLNDASKDELIAVNGIGPVLALKIVQHRPYRSEQQPLDENVIPPSAYEALRDYMKRSA